jgi:tol-pal system protein YbgF
MTCIKLRPIVLPAIAVVMVATAYAASAQSERQTPGFLDNLFGGSDRLSPQPEPSQAGPGQGGPNQGGRIVQAPGADLSMRLDRLEGQIRQLTGAIEQLQYRNQQLETQLQEMRGPTARAPAPAAPTGRPAVAPNSPPPPAVPGRRGDAFDPSHNPTAPSAPRVLGSPSNTASMPPTESAIPDEPQIGAPGGRNAGAPLDLSTMAGAAVADPSLGQGGPPAVQAETTPPPARTPDGAGQRVATLPPSDSPKDNFDLAYGYVLRKDYALAEDGFRAFLTKFPSDRLAPDAQYWLGESLFQRQQFRDAAEVFLTVSTKFETTGKAPDALLRLGQSLAALGEKEAACASLGEVLRKYPRASVGVKQGVDREQKRVRC